MEFERPLIERAVCEIRYSSTLVYHEKRIGLCQQIRERKPEFVHWKLGTPIIELRDNSDEAASNKIVSISSRDSRLILRNPGVYDNFIAFADFLMGHITSELRIDDLMRIGIRIYYFAEVKDGFEQLRDALATELFNKKALQRITPSVEDLAFIMEFKKNAYNFNVRVGALSPEEIEGKVYKGQRFYVRKEKLKPSLLVDVDYFKNNCSSREIRASLRTSKTETQNVLNNIISVVEEKT